MRSPAFALAFNLLVLPMDGASAEAVVIGSAAATLGRGVQLEPSGKMPTLVQIEMSGRSIDNVAGSDTQLRGLAQKAVHETEMSGASLRTWAMFLLDAESQKVSGERSIGAESREPPTLGETARGGHKQGRQGPGDAAPLDEDADSWIWGATFVCALAFIAAIVIARRGVARTAFASQARAIEHHISADTAAPSEQPSERFTTGPQ